MRLQGTLLAVAAALLIGIALIASAQTPSNTAPTFPAPTEGQYVHTPPSYDDIPERAKGCPGMNPLNQAA